MAIKSRHQTHQVVVYVDGYDRKPWIKSVDTWDEAQDLERDWKILKAKNKPRKKYTMKRRREDVRLCFPTWGHL